MENKIQRKSTKREIQSKIKHNLLTHNCRKKISLFIILFPILRISVNFFELSMSMTWRDENMGTISWDRSWVQIVIEFNVSA